MRCALSLAAGLVLLVPNTTARACDPVDATAYVAANADGFVFVTRTAAVRVSASGAVEHRRALPDDGGRPLLLPDGRTLLRLVPTGPSMDCRAARMRFELVDTASDARPRVVGTLPGRGDGVDVHAVMASADGALTVRLATYLAEDDMLVYDDVRVGPDTRRVRAVRVSGPEGDEPAPPQAPPSTAPLRIAMSEDEETLEVRDPSGTVRVRVGLTSYPASRALGADSRHLAVVTYSVVNEDYGTGWDARLEIVDLTSGARVAAVGDGTAISAIRGRVQVSCSLRVHDPSSQLNVRAAPSPRAAVVATLAHDRVVTVAEERGRWRRLSAPSAGWVWAASLRRACSAAPP